MVLLQYSIARLLVLAFLLCASTQHNTHPALCTEHCALLCPHRVVYRSEIGHNNEGQKERSTVWESFCPVHPSASDDDESIESSTVENACMYLEVRLRCRHLEGGR